MSEEKYIEDLREIKDIMNRSSRFISLSGWSGISAGIFALIGAYAAYQTVYFEQDYLGYRKANITYESMGALLIIAIVTLLCAVITSIIFTRQKANAQGTKLWDLQTKRLLINLAIPLTTGGILSLMLLLKGYVGIVAPLTLIFYGLALVNASKYTLNEIRVLGLMQIVLGLFATHYIGYGLLFWSIGFGLFHIIYGILMQIRYKS